MEFNLSIFPMCAIGFEKAFFHHTDDSIIRLTFFMESGKQG